MTSLVNDNLMISRLWEADRAEMEHLVFLRIFSNADCQKVN